MVSMESPMPGALMTHMPVIPVRGRQSQMDLDEFQASLVGTCMSHGGCARDDTRFPNEIVLGSNTEDRSF